MSCLKGIRVFAKTVHTDWELNGSSGKLNGKINPFLINVPVFYPPKVGCIVLSEETVTRKFSQSCCFEERLKSHRKTSGMNFWG